MFVFCMYYNIVINVDEYRMEGFTEGGKDKCKGSKGVYSDQVMVGGLGTVSRFQGFSFGTQAN